MGLSVILQSASADFATTGATVASLAAWLGPSARDLRVFRQDTLPVIALVSIFATIGLLTIFHLLRGRVRLHVGRTGRTVPRFVWQERAAHWVMAASFVILALTGLNKTLGRQTLLPLMSPESFAKLSRAAREMHTYAGVAFSTGLILAFVMWVRDNIPSRSDIAWLASGGALSGARTLPVDRFNGGQKILFWSVMLGGVILSTTGYCLLFPDAVLSGSAERLASMVHGLLAALLMSLVIAHAYIGSLGMEGAIDGMLRGGVDLSWARQHHELWARRFDGGDNEATAADQVRQMEGGHIAGRGGIE